MRNSISTRINYSELDHKFVMAFLVELTEMRTQTKKKHLHLLHYKSNTFDCRYRKIIIMFSIFGTTLSLLVFHLRMEIPFYKAIPIIIFVSHYQSMAKPISQSGEQKESEKKNILKCK